MSRFRIQSVAIDDATVTVTWADGHAPTRFPFLWLRDHCRAPDSFNAETQQRQVDTVRIPPDIAARDARVGDGGGTLEIDWDRDPVRSILPADFLRSVADPAAADRPDHRTWRRADWAGGFASVDYDRFMQDDRQGLLPCLERLERDGFAFVTGAPATPAATEAFAERAGGFIRHTIFGGFWDFTANLAFKDTAYTTQAIGPHTDGTYSFDPPGYQIFHCLEFDGEGGESTLVDGFAVAEILRDEAPDAFAALSETDVPAQYIGDGAHLMATNRILSLDAAGRPRRVAYNNYDRAPFLLPPERMERFYAGLRAFDRLVNDPELEIEFGLRPGTILIFDNWRTLHGRRAYRGSRRLAGAYLNKEDVESRLRVLRAG